MMNQHGQEIGKFDPSPITEGSQVMCEGPDGSMIRARVLSICGGTATVEEMKDALLRCDAPLDCLIHLVSEDVIVAKCPGSGE